MSLLTIILLLSLVIFITHMLEAVTGFGCSVLAFPFVIAITGDIGLSKILLSVLAWILALYIAIVKYRKINWRQFGIIVSLAALGLPIGMYIFGALDAKLLTRLLGAFIVLSAGIQIYKLFWAAKKEETFSRWNYLYLFFGGIVHGAFATGGPLMVLYSAKKLKDKGEFRATMCLLWATLNTVLMIRYLIDGSLTPQVQFDLLALMPALVLGIIAGELIHHRINETLFRKVVFVMLFVVGLVMLVL